MRNHGVTGFRCNNASTKCFSERPFLWPSSSTSPRRPCLHSFFTHSKFQPVANAAVSLSGGLSSNGECEVETVMTRDGMEGVTARISIRATVTRVWKVLTDFERLVEIVPYLIECTEVPSPSPKFRRLKQSAGLKYQWWKLQAQALLDVQVTNDTSERKELCFQLVEGDFKEYRGRFVVEADPIGKSSVLIFEAVFELCESIPRMLMVQAVKVWLPFNLNAIVSAAEENAQSDGIATFQETKREETRSSPNRKTDFTVGARRRRREIRPADYLGTATVLLPSAEPDFREKSMYEPQPMPLVDSDVASKNGIVVQMRKLDSGIFLHRRLMCCIRISAPEDVVWGVLTDYERLHEFVPNLLTSEVLPRPNGAPNNCYRLRQVAHSFQTYLQLQAESVIDVVEKPQREVQFRQVTGVVRTLQGKWILKPTESKGEKDTLLTYALEIKISISDIPLQIIEPVFEHAVIEGLPTNLLAFKREVMRIMGRPSPSRLNSDFEALREEIARCYEQTGDRFPTRNQLRNDKRSDIEKAISAHGGPVAVSERMGWKLQVKKRKRRGYWDDFDNLKQELMDFKEVHGLKMTPTKADFNQAGRADLRRAVEKWGGMHEVEEIILLDIEAGRRALAESDESEDETIEAEDEDMGRTSKMSIDVRDMDFYQ